MKYKIKIKISMPNHNKGRYPVIFMDSAKSICNKCLHWFALEKRPLGIFLYFPDLFCKKLYASPVSVYFYATFCVENVMGILL